MYLKLKYICAIVFLTAFKQVKQQQQQQQQYSLIFTVLNTRICTNSPRKIIKSFVILWIFWRTFDLFSLIESLFMLQFTEI